MDKIKLLQLHGQSNQIGPAYCQKYVSMSLGNFIVLQSVLPVETNVQKLTHYYYGPKWMAPLIKFVLYVESIMVRKLQLELDLNFI